MLRKRFIGLSTSAAIALLTHQPAHAVPGNGSNAASPIVAPITAGNPYPGYWCYGVTYSGGQYGKGVIYESTCWPTGTLGGTYNVLYNFGATANDGANGVGQLSYNYGDSTLYGITEKGGRNNYGTVFRFRPDHLVAAGKAIPYTQLYSFDGPTLGATPTSVLATGSMADTAGVSLYGTTYVGSVAYTGSNSSPSSSNAGNVFKLTVKNLNGSLNLQPSLLHGFYRNYDGMQPMAQLLLSSDGYGSPILYGTTAAGGPYDGGTLFSLNARTLDFTILHTFGGYSGTGYSPRCALIRGYAPDANKLLGTTRYGGSAANYGSIFQFDLSPAPGAPAYTQLYAFSGVDGAYPANGLAIDQYESARYGGVYAGVATYGGSSYVNNANPGGGTLYFYTKNGNSADPAHPAPNDLKPGFNLFYSFVFPGGIYPAGPVATVAPGNSPAIPAKDFVLGATVSGNPPYYGQQGYGDLWELQAPGNTNFDWKLNSNMTPVATTVFTN